MIGIQTSQTFPCPEDSSADVSECQEAQETEYMPTWSMTAYHLGTVSSPGFMHLFSRPLVLIRMGLLRAEHTELNLARK